MRKEESEGSLEEEIELKRGEKEEGRKMQEEKLEVVRNLLIGENTEYVCGEQPSYSLWEGSALGLLETAWDICLTEDFILWMLWLLYTLPALGTVYYYAGAIGPLGQRNKPL